MIFCSLKAPGLINPWRLGKFRLFALAAGFLMVHAFPYNIITVMTLLTAMDGAGAPLIAVFVGAFVTVVAWVVSVNNLYGEKNFRFTRSQ